VVIGSAGSGKTVLTLEKMKELDGAILYVTHSAHLADMARRLYYAEGYENEDQRIDFLSFKELLETISVPQGQEATYPHFKSLFERVKANFKLKDGHKVFEEIRGVITGTALDRAYLTLDDYQGRGVKQSIFLDSEREQVYRFFERYLQWLKEERLYDPNILAHEYRAKLAPRYDFAVIDEVQDFTLIQLDLILKSLRRLGAFVMSGDSNQIVHPNFFSWAKIKSYFYEDAKPDQHVMHILRANYRSGAAVTELANRILLLKQKRFGSVDRESHFLVDARHPARGEVQLLEPKPSLLRELDQKTRRSTKACVIVLRDDFKAAARQFFGTPLVFNIHEAKGLEYDTVILYNIVSYAAGEFRAITEGIEVQDLIGDLVYSRAKDKSDKSAEVYKFYINSLYVAVSRAIERLVIIEDDYRHLLWSIVDLTKTDQSLTFKAQESSLDDWQREARKLELQGRLDQAAEIRRDILKTVPVPWRVMTLESYPEILKEALSQTQPQKKSQHLLFEFAVSHRGWGLFQPLVDAKYSYAKDLDRNTIYVRQKLYGEASKPQSKVFWDHIKLHGIEHRNTANETPLMAAVRGGGIESVQRLLDLGADRDVTDTFGMTAFQKGLADVILSANSATLLKANHATILSAVAPSFTRIKVGDRMYKLDAKNMEFFLINALAGTFMNFLARQVEVRGVPSLTSAQLESALQHLSPRILPEHRKKRTYLNGILAKNALGRLDQYNRLLFLRQSVGHYMVNPLLEVDINGQWRNFYDYLGIELFPNFYPKGYKEWFEKVMPHYRQEAAAALQWMAEQSTPRDSRGEVHS
jgi:hypothetical protein